MKQFKTWRYKCDFCGKNGYSAGHMRSHERTCTANPDRTCRIHKHADLRIENPGPLPVSDLLAVLRTHWHDEDHGVSALREAAEACPCCMLAAIRQTGASKGGVEHDGYIEPWIGTDRFDFKGELKMLWETVNERAYERGL
jgi:hypothetical protein